MLLGGLIVPVVGYTYPDVPNTPAAGQPISASDMAENFKHLADGITNLEQALSQRLVYVNPETNGQYSLNASYCAVTQTTTANLGGWTTAKDLCEAACSDSPSAHVCSTREITRWVSTGGTSPPSGYVTNDASTRFIPPDSLYSRADCNGWTSNAGGGSTNAIIWNNDTGYFGAVNCGGNYPLLCCD